MPILCSNNSFDPSKAGVKNSSFARELPKKMYVGLGITPSMLGEFSIVL
jgi:hypothetical protein